MQATKKRSIAIFEITFIDDVNEPNFGAGKTKSFIGVDLVTEIIDDDQIILARQRCHDVLSALAEKTKCWKATE